MNHDRSSKVDALTVGELRTLLARFEDKQKIVFSDLHFGDFDLIGDTGARLSQDNFEEDRRPILRLRKRAD